MNDSDDILTETKSQEISILFLLRTSSKDETTASWISKNKYYPVFLVNDERIKDKK